MNWNEQCATTAEIAESDPSVGVNPVVPSLADIGCSVPCCRRFYYDYDHDNSTKLDVG